MSVDKFGRYSGDLVTKAQRGLPGEGFKLTDDGNYNISNKRLCNVGDPQSDDEAVNVKYMKQNSITLANDRFDVEMKRITNLVDPADALDAVNKKYFDYITKTALRERIPVKVKGSAAYSFKNNCITQITPPTGKSDAVNLGYMKENTINLNKENNAFNAENRIIERLHVPKQQQDAANKLYVDSKLPDSLTHLGCCDFKQNRLTNVANPEDDADVINKRTLVKVMQIFKHDLEEYTDTSVRYKQINGALDFQNAKLVNIGIPEGDNDAVTKSYVESLLLEYNTSLLKALFNIYKELNPGKSKDDFDKYIYHKV